MTTIYLIRHAQSVSNLSGRFVGQFNVPLSEQGKAQLIDLAEHFREIHLDALYASPLMRARDTAIAAGSNQGLTPILRPRLMEICGGVWENMTWDDIKAKHAEEYRLWKEEPWNFRVEGGESMREVYDRVAAEMTCIAEENDGKTVAVASHGCAIRNFMCYAYGIGIEAMNSLPFFANAGVCRLSWERDGGFRVLEAPADVCYDPSAKQDK